MRIDHGSLQSSRFARHPAIAWRWADFKRNRSWNIPVKPKLFSLTVFMGYMRQPTEHTINLYSTTQCTEHRQTHGTFTSHEAMPYEN